MTSAIENGEYVAEFYENRSTRPIVFHYVISIKSSTEILAMGQAFSSEAVQAEARKSLDQFASEREAGRPRKMRIVG